MRLLLAVVLGLLACSARLGCEASRTAIPCTGSCQLGLICGKSGYCFVADRWGDNPVGGTPPNPLQNIGTPPTPVVTIQPVTVPSIPVNVPTTPVTSTPVTVPSTPVTSTPVTVPSTPTTGGSTGTTVVTTLGSDASGTGDPQFIGLDGRLFFFDGLPHEYFNLVSEENHQLNALFVPGPHKKSELGEETNGTFLGEFGLKAYGTVVTIKVDEQGYMSAIVNGEKIGHDELAKHQFTQEITGDKRVMVVVEEYRENLGQAVTVITPLFEFIFFPTIRHWDPEFNETTRGHLNLALSVEVDDVKPGSIHGVLGQTTPDRAPVAATLPDELQTLFLGEGEPKDYQVSSLLADDFKYNQYHGAEPARRSNMDWIKRDGPIY